MIKTGHSSIPLSLLSNRYDSPGVRAIKRQSRDDDASASKRERKDEEEEEEEEEGEKASETFERSATARKSDDRTIVYNR